MKGNLRNRPCRCGKHMKYKFCCLRKDEGWTEIKRDDGRSYWEKK